MEIKAVLKQGVGKKSGKPYTCVELTFPNGYKKVVFPQGAESFVWQQCLDNK